MNKRMSGEKEIQKKKTGEEMKIYQSAMEPQVISCEYKPI